MLKNHPTPKPVDMPVDAIMDVTDRDDMALDPFGGSGSTLMAAVETERAALLIEFDPVYCDFIIRRWRTRTGEQAIHDENGDRFDAWIGAGHATVREASDNR